VALEKPKLTVELLRGEARRFAVRESSHAESTIYGVTDGKRIGTYFEQKFRSYILGKYTHQQGNAASGIDFPGIQVDMKVTSDRQPQSSCPFTSARQKIFGLGYHLLVFVYDKFDDPATRTGLLKILHTIFVDQSRTGDYQTTRGLLEIIDREGNVDDVTAFLLDRRLPIDEIGAKNLANEILQNRPQLGYLTISNALQWRLQYRRVINEAGQVDGIHRDL
jgi:hypothetical protein